MKSRRAYAIHHVFAAVAVAAALAAGWAPAFQAAFLNSARGVDRARVRAVANSAWAMARARLERGKDPTQKEQVVLDGRASIGLRRESGRLRLEIDARAPAHGAWIHSRLEIELRLEGSGERRRVTVLSRRELGA